MEYLLFNVEDGYLEGVGMSCHLLTPLPYSCWLFSIQFAAIAQASCVSPTTPT